MTDMQDSQGSPGNTLISQDMPLPLSCFPCMLPHLPVSLSLFGGKPGEWRWSTLSPTPGSIVYQSLEENNLFKIYVQTPRHCCVVSQKTLNMLQTTARAVDEARVWGPYPLQASIWREVIEIHNKVWWQLDILVNKKHVSLLPSATLPFLFSFPWLRFTSCTRGHDTLGGIQVYRATKDKIDFFW